MMRTIVLCADDYAYTAPISRAILELAGRRRISALSCMTASPHWPEHGRWLKDAQPNVDIGLHMTLVDEVPLTKMPRTAPGGRLPDIATLIRRSYLGLLDLAEIEGEIRAQKLAFESVMGFPPRHVDGHLHTHVLPGIRNLVLDMVRTLSPQPWVRSIHERYATIIRRGIAVPKAALLSALGHRLVRAAGSMQVAMNDSFSGVYAFSPENTNYGAMFEKFVGSARGRHLILCHPGEATDTAAHASLRGGEYAFLKSSALLEILARHDLKIGRFGEIAP